MRVGLQWEWSWVGGKYLGHHRDESAAAGVMLQLRMWRCFICFMCFMCVTAESADAHGARKSLHAGRTGRGQRSGVNLVYESHEEEKGSLHQVTEWRQAQLLGLLLLLLLLLLGDCWLLLPGSHVARHQSRWCERLQRREICTRQLVLWDEGTEEEGEREREKREEVGRRGIVLHHTTFWSININQS